MTFMEYYGLFENWRERKEIKEDAEEYYGLSPSEIAVCKEAKAINKIKYEEALKIRWEEIAKHAIRPEDKYHTNLLNQVIKPSIELPDISVKDDTSDEEENNIIEMYETDNNVSPVISPRKSRHILISNAKNSPDI